MTIESKQNFERKPNNFDSKSAIELSLLGWNAPSSRFVKCIKLSYEYSLSNQGLDEKGYKMVVDSVDQIEKSRMVNVNVHVNREKCIIFKFIWLHFLTFNWSWKGPFWLRKVPSTSTSRKMQAALFYGQRRPSTSAFLLVNNRQPFSSRPKLVLPVGSCN